MAMGAPELLQSWPIEPVLTQSATASVVKYAFLYTDGWSKAELSTSPGGRRRTGWDYWDGGILSTAIAISSSSLCFFTLRSCCDSEAPAKISSDAKFVASIAHLNPAAGSKLVPNLPVRMLALSWKPTFGAVQNCTGMAVFMLQWMPKVFQSSSLVTVLSCSYSDFAACLVSSWFRWAVLTVGRGGQRTLCTAMTHTRGPSGDRSSCRSD
eukprot:26748-Rhodomonas_salina.1